jgi:nucleotide-binding universal stress UspA family protein
LQIRAPRVDLGRSGPGNCSGSLYPRYEWQGATTKRLLLGLVDGPGPRSVCRAHPADFTTANKIQGAEEATKTKFEEQVQKIRDAGIEVAGAHTREGFPDEEIVGLAGRLSAGLIVMGSRGLGPLRRALMGSVSDSVVRRAHCPVLVMRQEKERSAQDEADFLT